MNTAWRRTCVSSRISSVTHWVFVWKKNIQNKHSRENTFLVSRTDFATVKQNEIFGCVFRYLEIHLTKINKTCVLEVLAKIYRKVTFVLLSFCDLVSDTKQSEKFLSNSKLEAGTINSVPLLLNNINGLLHLGHGKLVTFHRSMLWLVDPLLGNAFPWT
jgi:hypothetical protein